ncbi:MAG: DUF2226 domain-containing protein [Candidatus ainarchaeum sp.]|nr:DUF2226 domain-containing protein [Candidatus ainarchaeum sp.]
MDLPVGEFLESGIIVKGNIVKEKVAALLETDFAGYVVITIEGRSGIEEGALLLQQNRAIGAIFDYLRFSKKVLGEEAVAHFFNAAKADFGVMDIISLTKQQIELIIAFNEKIELGKPLLQRDLAKIGTEKFNPGLAESALGNELLKRESRFDVFRKVGLTEFTRKID